MIAERTMEKVKMPSGGQPEARNRPSKTCSAWISRAIAYIEMPELNTVITANEQALRARVFSSKRRRRNSGTERAFEP